jgi:hypothetical protein
MIKTIIKQILRRVISRLTNNKLHDCPSYYTNRFEKKIDIAKSIPDFSELSCKIISEGKTYLREDRLYTIYQALQQVPSGSNSIELGVYNGGASKFIAAVLKKRGNGIHFACDTFSGHALVDSGLDGNHEVNKGFANVISDDVSNYLNQENIRIVIGDIIKTADKQKFNKIGFIHMDMDVYPPTKFALNYFWPKILRGGVVIGDDYGTSSCPGMKKAVDEFILKTKDCFSLHLITGQILLIKM